jgi:RimJ/RimL family protein N-acetyltransferase
MRPSDLACTPSAVVLETPRLILRRLTVDDAPFMLTLLNEPSFFANIGDKGVRTLDQARQFLLDSHIASYERNGYGHYRVDVKETGEPIGTCGLINREALKAIDIGFAYLPAYWSRGYATEAALAVMDYGRRQLGLQKIVAIVSPHNSGSIRVLEKLGLRFDRPVQMVAGGETIHLYT